MVIKTNISLAISSLIAGTVMASSPLSKPNIIVILSDDHGYADIAIQGARTDLKTPNLDKFAKEGTILKNGYVTAPQSVPSRAGIMSGQYQQKFGVETNDDFTAPGAMVGFNNIQTIAERLKPAGYVTGMTGKWHLGPDTEIMNHGFDYVYPKMSSAHYQVNFDFNGNLFPQLVTENTGLYHLDACSEAALAFIKKNATNPFFLYLAYRAPHTPLDPPQSYLNRFPGTMPECRRRALAMISAMDDGLGRIMQSLKDLNIDENTLIFYFGDNGAPLKMTMPDLPDSVAGWNGSINLPMNGEKGMLTEGGIHTPFLVRWKGTIPAGQVYEKPVISLDIAATAVSLAGLPTAPELDGVNLIPYITNANTGNPHDALYWRWGGQAAILKDSWKFIKNGGSEYLFNLSTDISETKNVVLDNPALRISLKEQLKTWSNSLQDKGIEFSTTTAANTYFDFFVGKPLFQITNNLNDSLTWETVGLPVAGDNRVWSTDARTLHVPVTPFTFYGDTFVIENGGTLDFNINTPVVTFNNLTLNGGQINHNKALLCSISLNNKNFLLNSGSIKAGALSTNRDIRFSNAILKGNGTINIIGYDSIGGADVEFMSTVNTKGFTGVFDINNHGILNLSAIPIGNASFGIKLSGTGKYTNDADVAITSLNINGTSFAPGTYSPANFTTAQKAFLIGTNKITVVSANDLNNSFENNDLSVSLVNGKLNLIAQENQILEVYNALGQKLIYKKVQQGNNAIDINFKGIIIVKLGNQIAKLKL